MKFKAFLWGIGYFIVIKYGVTDLAEKIPFFIPIRASVLGWICAFFMGLSAFVISLKNKGEEPQIAKVVQDGKTEKKSTLFGKIAYVVGVGWILTNLYCHGAGDDFSEGLLYWEGKGVAKLPEKAIKCFHKAAGRGYAPAQYFLGVCYMNGDGVPQDKAAAARWFMNAANREFADAQYALALCFWRGDGVEKDEDTSISWLLIAARNGSENARKLLDDLEK